MSSRRRYFLIVAIVALAIGFIITWYAGLRNRFEPVNFGIVEPGKVFRSGQISQHVVRQTLEQNHIGVIINLTGDDTVDGKAEDLAARDMGLKRVRLSLGGDGLGDPTVYPRALAEIVRANHDGKAVLVHCQSGAQRTGGVIAAYRIIVEGKSPDNAFAEMREYGHDPAHNPLLIPFILQHLPEWKTQFDKYQIDSAAAPATQPTS
jgi:protein tyrosine/serine phosphatase